MYEIKHNLSENYLKHLFIAVNGNYNLRSKSYFRVPGINTVFYSGFYIIGTSVMKELRNVCDFDLSNTTLRKWKPADCACRLGKN